MKKQYKWLAIAISVVVIIYMTYNAFAYTYSPVTTQRLTQEVENEETFSFTGFVLRDEKAIDSTSSGTVISLANDGKRVAKGDLIAISCANENDASIYTRLESAKAEFQRLSTLNNQNGVNELNSEKLNNEINSAYSQVMDSILNDDFSSLAQSIEGFNDKSATKQILSEGNIELGEKLNTLQEEINSLENKDIKYTEIQSPSSGYFINNLDGYETTLNFKEVLKLSATQIESAIKAKPQTASSNSGKLVSSYRWYIAGVVENKYSRSFPVGKIITINLADEGLTNIQMKVEKVTNADGKITVILSSTLMNETFANLRIETVEVIENSYSGYKIPSKAIRFDEENNSGVYVLRGKIISFIPVEIIYSHDDYTIVSSSKVSGSGLTLYDEVITKGRDLYDGKVII